MNWTTWKQNFLRSPKSTITGICGLAIAIILAIYALPPKTSGALIAVAVLRAVVDFSKQDAGTTLAIAPGSSTPQQVSSHEVPDDPAAVAVPQVSTVVPPEINK